MRRILEWLFSNAFLQTQFVDCIGIDNIRFLSFFLLPHKTTQQAVADSVSMTNFSLIQIQFDQSAVELISYQFNDEDRFSFFSLIVINCSILFILHRFQI